MDDITKERTKRAAKVPPDPMELAAKMMTEGLKMAKRAGERDEIQSKAMLQIAHALTSIAATLDRAQRRDAKRK